MLFGDVGIVYYYFITEIWLYIALIVDSDCISCYNLFLFLFHVLKKIDYTPNVWPFDNHIIFLGD